MQDTQSPQSKRGVENLNRHLGSGRSAPLIRGLGAHFHSTLRPVGLGAARRDDLHGDALGLADQRPRDRGSDGNLALAGVGLRFADDLPDLLLVAILVDQGDGGAEPDGVAGKLRNVNRRPARACPRAR